LKLHPTDIKNYATKGSTVNLNQALFLECFLRF